MNDAVVVMAALARLTPGQREAYVDAVVLERPHIEIAGRVGITSQRVGQLVRASQERIATDPILKQAA